MGGCGAEVEGRAEHRRPPYHFQRGVLRFPKISKIVNLFSFGNRLSSNLTNFVEDVSNFQYFCWSGGHVGGDGVSFHVQRPVARTVRRQARVISNKCFFEIKHSTGLTEKMFSNLNLLKLDCDRFMGIFTKAASMALQEVLRFFFF